MPYLLPTGTWLLIGDGEKALFLRNDGTATEPDLTVTHSEKTDNPPTREQAADRPGRYNDGPNVQRSAVEETDWHTFEKLRFARDIAEHLGTLHRESAFDKLVLVAPPRILGELRQHISDGVRACVIAEIDKDLTNHTVPQIAKLVRVDN